MTDSLATVRENVTSQKAVLVDVREKLEWNGGHVAGAVSLPISAIELRSIDPALLERLPKDRILYTYCVVGMRAKKAAGIMVGRREDISRLSELGYRIFTTSDRALVLESAKRWREALPAQP